MSVQVELQGEPGRKLPTDKPSAQTFTMTGKITGPKGAVEIAYSEERKREGDDATPLDPRENERVMATFEAHTPWLSDEEFSPNALETKGKWKTLLEAYCRDSYDGEYQLVLEDGTASMGTADMILEQIGSPLKAKQLFKALAKKSSYPKGFKLLFDQEFGD